MPASFPSLPWFQGALCALTFLTARGQESASLNLGEALDRAAQRNPALLAQAYAERSANGRLEQAGLRPNPTLEVSAENFLGTGARQGVQALEATVQASQTFERGGKRGLRVSAAERERAAVVGEFSLRRAEVLADTAAAFVEALSAQRKLEAAEEPWKLGREVVASAEARVQAGMASPAEVARARAEAAMARGEWLRAQAEWAAARTRLAATWGGSVRDVPRISGNLRVPDQLPEETELTGKLSAHPRLAWQRALVEAHRAALDLERAQATPDVSVGAGLRFLHEGSDAAWVAGVSVPLPVRNRNQGNIRAARESVAEAEYRVQAVEVELRTTLEALWLEVAAAHAAVQNLRSEVIPAAEEARSVVGRSYAEGQLPLIDVLDSQRTLVALRRQLLEHEAAYVAALARAESMVDSRLPLTTALLNSP